jgi:hypothetical protein
MSNFSESSLSMRPTTRRSVSPARRMTRAALLLILVERDARPSSGTAVACGAVVSVEFGYLDDEQWRFPVAFRRNHVDDSQSPATAL